MEPAHSHPQTDHGHAHERGHEHGHGHHHHGPTAGTAFAVGVVLNVGFVIVGIGAGYLANSAALIADSLHNAGDVLGLLLAWGAMVLARRAPSSRRSYGHRRVTMLATLGNALLIVAAVGGIAWEAVGRLQHPSPVNGGLVAIVAAIGVVINMVSARMFHHGQAHDMNQRGAYLHLLGDAAISAAVVVAGLVVRATGWMWLDPALSLLVALVVLVSTWGLLRDALALLTDMVPKHIEAAAVEAYLASLPDVTSVHDLHIWSLSTTEVALTAHLVIAWQPTAPSFLCGLEQQLEQRFGIHHVTVQLEPAELSEQCARAKTGSL